MLLASSQTIYQQLFYSDSWHLESKYHLEKYSSPGSQSQYCFPKLPTPIYNNTTSHQYHEQQQQQPNLARNLTWSHDGTSFITSHEDFGIRVFLLDADLLTQRNGLLVPINRLFQNSPIISHAVNPDFSFYNKDNTANNVLISQRGVTIKLLSLIPDSDKDILLSFKFEDIRHDLFLDATAISFMQDPKNFICGSTNAISIFDISRTKPIVNLKIPKLSTISFIEQSELNSNIYIGSYVKNEISILTPNCDQVVMKSTLKRGTGINQLIESENGRYLYAISRNQIGIPILDLRMDLQQVGFLSDWQEDNQNNNNKNQKLLADKLPHSKGLIAGSNHGEVKVWPDSEMGLDCKSQVLLKLKSQDQVSCVKMNPIDEANILGLTIGSRYDDSRDTDDVENINNHNHGEICLYDIEKKFHELT